MTKLLIWGIIFWCKRVFYPFAERKTKKMTITKDTIIGSIIDNHPEVAPLFLSIGMHCLTCPCSRGETVEEACGVHGINADDFVATLNAEISK